MHGSILAVTIPSPPRATPGANPVLLAWEWEIFSSVLVPGVEGYVGDYVEDTWEEVLSSFDNLQQQQQLNYLYRVQEVG